VLALALGLGSVFVRGRALAGVLNSRNHLTGRGRSTSMRTKLSVTTSSQVISDLDETGWRRLLAADSAWGAAAGLWLVSGLGRVFFGGKETAFYWRNGFFWVKMLLFAIVFVLELAPMMTFIRVRAARRSGQPLPRFPLEAYRRINSVEIALVVTIVFVAAFMARGAWLF
jgi:putative membrane protein